MSFVREFPVNAVRKPHGCDVCGKQIAVGDPAVRWVGNPEGDFWSSIFHPECREAEIAYNHLIHSNWDEWVPLKERECEDDEWVLVEHPVVAARLGIRTSTQGQSA